MSNLESLPPKSPVPYSSSNQKLIDAAFSVLSSSGANSPKTPLSSLSSSNIPSPGQSNGIPLMGTQTSSSPAGLTVKKSKEATIASALNKAKKMYTASPKSQKTTTPTPSLTPVRSSIPIKVPSPMTTQISPVRTATPIRLPSSMSQPSSPFGTELPLSQESLPISQSPITQGSSFGTQSAMSQGSSFGSPMMQESSFGTQSPMTSFGTQSPMTQGTVSPFRTPSPIRLPTTVSQVPRTPSPIRVPTTVSQLPSPIRVPTPVSSLPSLPTSVPPLPRVPSPFRSLTQTPVSRTPSPIRLPSLPRTPSPSRTPLLPVRSPTPMKTPSPNTILPTTLVNTPLSVKSPFSNLNTYPTLDVVENVTPEEHTLLSVHSTPHLETTHTYDKSLLDVHYLPFTSINIENDKILLESYTPQGDICYIKVNEKHNVKYENMEDIVANIKPATSIPHNVRMSFRDYNINETAGVAFSCAGEMCILDRDEGGEFTETTVIYSKADKTLVNVENPIAYPVVLLSDVLNNPEGTSNQIRQATNTIQKRAFDVNSKHLEELRKNIDDLKSQETQLMYAFQKVSDFRAAETARYSKIRDEFLDIKQTEGSLSQENESRFKTVIDRLRNLNYVQNQFIVFMNNYITFSKQYVDILNVTNHDAYYSYFLETRKNFSPDISGPLLDAKVWGLPASVNAIDFRNSTHNNLIDMNGNKVTLPETESVKALLHAMGKH